MAKKLFAALLLAVLILAGPTPVAADDGGLVAVAAVDDTIVIDLRYATVDNFTGRQVYPHAVCLLRAPTAAKLAAANAELKTYGYRIKIWDAYRPPDVQRAFWQLVPDERYVAHPDKGSRHTRGGAVDVTLVDASGTELVMPSAFDDFSPRASRHSQAMSAEAARNLAILTQVMLRHGFTAIDSEWWHFEDNDTSFALLDVPFERFLPPTALASLEPDVLQAVVVTEHAPGDFRASLAAWRRTAHGWQQSLAPVAAVLGRNGLAPPGGKLEGDGRTPRGVYPLGTSFGYGDSSPGAMPYRQATAADYWVDDPASPDYNTWVRDRPAARTFEHMRRDDDLYKYGLVIEYNVAPVVPGRGSAIFLHLWSGPFVPTAGCVALAEADLLRLLAWLDPAGRPVIILGEP